MAKTGKTNKASGANFVPVLLGGDANAYGMARSFYEEYGVVSHAIGKGVFHICKFSRLMHFDITEPRLEEDEIFVETLRSFAKRFGGKPLVLAPCGDGYTKLLVRNQDALRDLYHFSIMTPDQFELLSTKDRFYRTCERFGLEFPKTDEVAKEGWRDYEPPFDFPVIMKPANSPMYWNCSYEGKKKVFVVRNADEMRRILEGVYSSSYTDKFIVQDFVPGDDSRMRVMNCFSDRNGKVTMMCLGDVVLEEHTPEGIGSYGAIMTGYDMDIAEKIRGFLEEIGYIGFSNFDLKFDERDGSYKLFEINPRQGRSSYFTTASGKNLARYLVRDALLAENRPCEIATLDDEVLWTMVPLDVIRDYTQDPAVLERVERLIAAKKVRYSYLSKDDCGMLRRMVFMKNQSNYREQYRNCFGHRHIDD